ncbi:hypothetical protein HDU67_004935 [Dinochytrium kinnereticum]|nr:hypothetical protein HDU67_004935 [Dinochytrium kinnereticum]
MPAAGASQALPAWVTSRIKEYAKRPLRQIAFSDMLKFGRNPTPEQLLGAAIFLADELPVRMAHRYQAIEAIPSLGALPKKPNTSPPAQLNPTTLPSDLKRIQHWYATSFKELVEFGQEVDEWRRNPEAVRLGHKAASSLLFPSFPSSSSASLAGRWAGKLSQWMNGSTISNRGIGNLALSGDLGAAASFEASLARVQRQEVLQKPQGAVDPEKLTYFGQTLEPHVAAAASHYNQRFEGLLTNIVERHNPIIVLLAKNFRDLSTNENVDMTTPRIQTFITKFFRARTGMRMLIGHHIALSRKRYRHPENIGIVCTQTDASEVASEAASDASEVCERNYGVSPSVEIHSSVPTEGFVFVPSHLHHVLFEILKNALRAVVERREGEVGVGNAEREDMEPVRIYIEPENEGQSLLIRVSDRGTGIRAGDRPKLFLYAYTTAKPARLDGSQFSGSETEGAPMAGFGYGLPLSRMYARYFNGDLTLTSKWGYGTDVYLTLHRSLEGIMEPYM